jgi:hypothetical protein
MVSNSTLVHFYAEMEAPSSTVNAEMMGWPTFQALEVTLMLSLSLSPPMCEGLAGRDSAKFLTLEHDVTCQIRQHPLTLNQIRPALFLKLPRIDERKPPGKFQALKPLFAAGCGELDSAKSRR